MARTAAWRLLALTLPLGQLVFTSQVPLTPSSPAPRPQTTTLVDLLSASPDHSHLVHLLQRARLIPTLNGLNHSTVFAPVNSAFEDAVAREAQRPASERVWARGLEEADEPDNVSSALRQRLLYHVLNYTLPYAPSDAPTDRPDMLETMYLPVPLDRPGAPGVPGKDPEEGVVGLLAGRGQRLRIVRRPAVKPGSESTFVGVDGDGKGGVQAVTVKDGGDTLEARNGVLIPLGGVLDVPPPLTDRIASEPSLAQFAALLPPALKDHLSATSHVTLFAPSDDAFKSLTELEWRYLRSAYGQAEMMDIYGAHATRDGLGANATVVYREEVQAGSVSNVTMIDKQTVDIEVDDKGALKVNGSAALQSDILASNGVLHVVPRLLLPNSTLDLNVEKYLLALDCARFVELFRSANLTEFLNATDLEPSSGPKLTILAPRDDVIGGWGEGIVAKGSSGWDGGWNSFPPDGSAALADLLRYHVISGQWAPDELEDGMLLGTELVIKKKLAGHRQRVTVSVSDSDGKGDGAQGLIGFGGASVVAEPVTVGRTIIYLLSQVLSPPSDAVQVAVTDLRLSTFVAAIYAARLDSTFRSAPAVTYWVPSNGAFEALGLVVNYLLLPKAREDLRRVLKYHAVDDILYLDDLGAGSQRWPTLEGSEIYVERTSDGNTTLHGPTVDGFPANGEVRDSKVIDGDWLTATGALHVIDQVEIPPTVEIGIGELMQGAKANTMLDLLRVSNMTWVLDGAEPATIESSTMKKKKKKGRKWKRAEAFEARSFTVLCPTDTAFTRINLTFYLHNPPMLEALVRQHIIPSDPPSKSAIRDPSLFPGDGRPLALEDGRVYPTLLSESGNAYGDVAFREWGRGNWIVGIKGARGSDGQHDAGRVVSFGRASPRLLHRDDVQLAGKGKAARMAFGGGVLTIGAVLEPYEPDAWHRWGWIVATVLICVVGVVAMAGMAWKLWKARQEAAYVVVEGQEED